MPNALKVFVKRNPVVLPGRHITSLGIQSHPPKYQSARFKEWLAHCEANDVGSLEAEILDFLRGQESVKAMSDLGDQWSFIVDSFLSYGPAITKEAAYQILRHKRTDTLFECHDRGPAPVRTRVADTLLGLARLKYLGHKSNIDYQSVLRVMTFVERAVTFKMELPELNIKQHFYKPVLLPTCFFCLDRCKGVQPATPFPYLPDAAGQLPAQRRTSRGCAAGNCTCKVNDECVDQSPCCATITPYVVDLMVVRDSTKCYLAGDLSFIKNILTGESLSTKHRRLERSEETFSTETETSEYLEKDLQVDDRSALHREIENTVSSDLSVDAGVTFNASWGKGVEYGLTTTSNVSYNQSKASSNKETTDYLRNVLERAVSRIEKKVKTSRTTTHIIETEETNDHGFMNQAGPNVSGQYLYVDKLSRAQVYNYGKRAVVDIYLPEPAALFIKLLEGKFDMVAPTPPSVIDINPSEITPDNYGALVTQHGLKDVPAPPPFQTSVEITLEGEPGDPKGKNKKSGSHIYQFNCSLPPDYVGVSMSVNNIRLNYNEGGGVSISASLGPNGDNVFHQDGGSYMYTASLPSIEGSHMVTVHTWDVTNFTWVLTLNCDLKPEAKAKWQAAVYSKVDAYNQAAKERYQGILDKYLEAKQAFDEEEAALRLERYNRDPLINRQIERTELKRMAISYISCQFFDEFDAMKSRVKPCGHPEMDIRDAEHEGRVVQFFEQAFDWNLMTYIFYRYFWGRKCTWADKLKTESTDFIFQQFLSAGSARVLVPVKDGFFDMVQYFLATGEIWRSNGIPPLPNDPHYVSMAQEVKEEQNNYYADREGTLDVTNGSNVVTLDGSDWYWTYADPLPTPPVPAGVNNLNVAADIDREIVIDCKVYRMVDIQQNSTVTTSWLVTLERNYEGATAQKLKWSTGALFVGAPWEFVTPTGLTFLRDKSSCLPCYPLKECKEAQ